jgi:hypothetical protein
MNKNATLMSHLQNAAIAVLTVTAVLLLIQTPLVGDLAGKTPYELAQDWLRYRRHHRSDRARAPRARGVHERIRPLRAQRHHDA